MSVRVVARIRPLLKAEIEKDIIVSSSNSDQSGDSNLVRIPNPRNDAELYSFQFNSVYDQHAVQQELFDSEGGHLSYHAKGFSLLTSIIKSRPLSNIYSKG